MDLKALKNKTIGIVGMGYLGNNLYNFIKKNSEGLNTKIYSFNKSNYKDIVNFNFDFFINTAGNSGDFRQNISETIESNINLTLFLLKNLNVSKKYIALSSTRIYGFSADKETLFNENHISESNINTIDYIYDGTKKLTESIVLNYPCKYDVTIVRLSNVYGKFDCLNDTTLIKKAVRYKSLKQQLKIDPATAYKSKDYIYIDDASEGILSCALFGKNRNVYNIASGKSYTLPEIAENIDLKLKISSEEFSPKYSQISIRKAEDELGFQAKMDITEGLLLTLKQIDESD